MSVAPRRIEILGVRIDNVTWRDIDELCTAWLNQAEPKQIVTVNGEHLLSAAQNPRHRTVINQAELVIPDSTNVVWVSLIKGQRLSQVTPGVDLIDHLAKLAVQLDKSIYLLGGRGTVPEQAAQKLQARYPGLKIAGTSTKNPDDISTVAEIKRSNAAIVLVAYGAPNQEYWSYEHKKAAGAQIYAGIGGALDMIAGVLPRAPKLLRTLHFEWLWRLLLQPSRFKRIWRAVVVFPLKALLN